MTNDNFLILFSQDASVTTEKRWRILDDFAKGEFQMLFISPDLRQEISGDLGPSYSYWKNVRAVIIEEFGSRVDELDFEPYLRA
jgi:hypothetical protein